MSLFQRYIAPCAFVCLTALTAVPAQAQTVSGSRMPGYADAFGVTLDQKSYPYSVSLIQSSTPGNILWPGEQPTFQFQVVNNGTSPIQLQGKVDVIAYGTRGVPGEIWRPQVVKFGDAGSTPIDVNVSAKGFANFTVSPKLPEKFGAYALVVDLGSQGRQFLTTCVRTFPNDPERIQYPHFCLDFLPLDVLKRLGVHAIRYGIPYKPTTDPDFGKWYAEQGETLKHLNDAGIAVLLMVGGGEGNGPTQPMGRTRPWLDANGVLLDGKSDYAWLPSYDADFQQYCKRFASDYGWPKGPVNAFSLWNEPWEGISISGWGADMLRYREMFMHLAQGVDEARRTAGVEVLTGGTDSTSNAMDKFFSDGKDTFMPYFDFASIHYQGLDPHSTIKAWLNRKSPRGRVRIWDTESWVANTDDRVAAVVAGDRAAGYDRAMGVFYGNIAEEKTNRIMTTDGKSQTVKVINAWSTAASVGASTHFLGERSFNRLLFKNGLPWVMVFDGMPDKKGKANPDDGTVVIVGDLAEEFGANQLPFRTARGFAEIAHKKDLRRQLAALPADAPAATRDALVTAIAQPEILSGATLTLPSGNYSLYDFYGNLVPAENGKITIPLDGRGFFLRANGKSGSFNTLVAALQSSRIEGIQPIAFVAHDLTAPIESHPSLHLSMTNVLNRPVTGTLSVTLGALTLAVPNQFTIGPNETKELEVPVTGGASVSNNDYPMSVNFDAGADGVSAINEDLHVNWISHKTITVDGDLSDWKNAIPQTVVSAGTNGPSLTEAAWFPFQKFDQSVSKGFATGYLAYDAQNFYFAAKVADSTPDSGMLRFASRNDDNDFYPDVSYQLNGATVLQKKEVRSPLLPTDIKLLQPVSGTDRSTAQWISTVKSFAIDLKIPAGQAHQIALYCQNSDADSRRAENITISNLDTGKVLAHHDVTDFLFGKYAVFTVAGNVRVMVTATSWLPAALSGIFFDAAPANLAANGTAAQFVKIDDGPQGNWKGVYGEESAWVFGTPMIVPSGVMASTPEVVEKIPLTWPAGVRHYSYRQRPDLPSGTNHDNVQIAFNVLSSADKPWETNPPGTMPGFINYKDTDYEYALNPVAPEYGGGTEVWRLEVPGMPHKQFYPRQPASPFDGPVTNAQLVIKRDGNTRIVEAAIPWTELPDVKKRLDAGQTIKFSFHVNDNAGGGLMELSRDRSVAKINGSFHVDWQQHWANELEFGWEH